MSFIKWASALIRKTMEDTELKRFFRLLAALILLAAALMSAGCGTGTPEKSRGYDEKSDLCLTIDGVKYDIRTDSAPLLAALGENYEFSEQISCIYEGMDKSFTYDGLKISTVPVDGKDIIEMFTITSDKYKTERGITIGASLEDIVAAYGDRYFDDGYITYTASNNMTKISEPRIQFYMVDGAVKEIYIYSPSY